MALQKEREVEITGVIADYIRIEDVRIENGNNTITLTVGIYLNKEARDAGKSPVSVQVVDLTTPVVSDAIVESLYNELKLLDKYADSLDV